MTATLTDESAFLAAIREAPQDDALRLIFADWLDGNGDEARGEFIRVQCELARLDEKLTGVQFGCDGKHSHSGQAGQIIHGILHENDPRVSHHHHDDRCQDPRKSLRSRERDLWLEFWTAWLDKDSVLFPGQGGVFVDCRFKNKYGEFKFARGFLSHVTLPMKSWIGRECERCRGSGNVPPPTNSDQWLRQLVDCVYCSGIGRVGALGPAIVRSPVSAVEVVTFSDKRPLYFGGKWWWRLAGHGVDDSHDLPKIVWWDHHVNGFISHDSESAALDAASRAAVTWATSQNRQSTI